MLCGYSPFRTSNSIDHIKSTVRNIRKCRYTFPDHITISDSARDLIGKLLNPEPSKRLGANGIAEIKKHQFFNGMNWGDVASKKMEAYINAKLIKKIQQEAREKKNSNDTVDRFETSLHVEGFTYVNEEVSMH